MIAASHEMDTVNGDTNMAQLLSLRYSNAWVAHSVSVGAPSHSVLSAAGT